MTDDTKTILHFITGLEKGGGAETFLSRVLPRLKTGKHIACSMYSSGEIGDSLKSNGIEVVSLDMSNNLDIRGIWRYKKIVQRVQPDIQINYLIHADIFGRIFGRLFNVPQIVSFIRNKHQNNLFVLAEKLTIGLVDCVLANSQAVMDFYKAQYILPSCTAVIPNGIPVSEISEVAKRDDTKFIITSVARLHPQKNLQTLIQAAGLLKKTIPNLCVQIVGEGAEREKLQSLTQKLNLSEIISFFGRRDDVGEILAGSDVFVLPSKKEGMSNALLEAMASGCACVVSDIPENTELIKHEQNGLTFRFGDSKDLAEQLQVLHDTVTLQERYASRARKDIIDHYSITAAENNLERFLADRLQVS